MKPRRLLAQVTTPDGSSMTLHEHDGTYSIRVQGIELMSTRRHASEETLAHLACAHLRSTPGAQVLIGGLGLGFTLRATLSQLRPDATVTVAELLDPVIEWNRNPEYPLAADALADRRVRLVRDDVSKLMSRASRAFDAILLDVDNGPIALTADGNQRLYQEVGLMQARGALRKDGCLAVWSASPDPAFAKLLSKCGFDVQVEKARAHATSGGWHTIFLARAR